MRSADEIKLHTLMSFTVGMRSNLLVARMQEKMWAPHSTNYVLEYVLDSNPDPDPLHMQILLLSGRMLGELLVDHYPEILDEA